MFRKTATICLGILMVIAMISMVHAPPAYAANYYWSGTTGDWSTPSNWGGTEPTASDLAYIDNNGTAQITTSGEAATRLYLGGSSNTTGNVSMSDGTLTVSVTVMVGANGVGAFTQTGGTHNVNSLYAGTYSGSSGTYNQSGGVVSIGSVLYAGLNAGTTGSYSLSDAGIINAIGKSEYIGRSGTGTFNQTGGTNNAGSLYVAGNTGGSGTYIQSAGVVSIGTSLSVGNSSSGGSYSLSGTGVLNATGKTEYIGQSGKGIFNQSGGTNNAGSLWVGVFNGSSGTYIQSAGLVSIGTELSIGYNPGSEGAYSLSDTGVINATGKYEYVGSQGKGTFTQSGGTNNLGYLYVGQYSGSNGTYAQSGGVVSVGSNLTIGYNSGATGSYSLSGTGVLETKGKEFRVGDYGAGTFEQTGGTHNSGTVTIGRSSGSSGTYILSGGVISLNGPLFYVGSNAGATGLFSLSGAGVINGIGFSENIGISGKGTFTQTGGTNNAGTLYVGVNSGSSGTYNQSGGVVSMGGNLRLANNTGAQGSYTLSDVGVLNAAGKAEYIGNLGTGTFTQTGGTHQTGTIYLGYSSGSIGTYTQSGGTAIVTSSLTLANSAGSSGTYNLQGGYLSIGTLTKGAGSSAFNMSGGTLRMTSLSAGVINFNGGKLQVGTYTGALVVPDGGIIAPGDSPGTTVVNGAATFNSGSILQIEIGGTSQGVTYDWLDVNGGNVVFDSGSKIQLSWWNGYTAPLSTSFDIITWDNGYTFTDNGFTLENPNMAQFTYAIDNVNRKLTVTYSSAVPEPATIVSMLSGLLLLSFRRVLRMGETRKMKKGKKGIRS